MELLAQQVPWSTFPAFKADIGVLDKRNFRNGRARNKMGFPRPVNFYEIRDM